jgi:hypothetical protein
MKRALTRFTRSISLLIVLLLSIGGAAGSAPAWADQACAHCIYLPALSVSPELEITHTEILSVIPMFVQSFQGLVESTSNVTITNVLILFEQFDRFDGTLIVSRTISPLLHAIPPHGKVPFSTDASSYLFTTERATLISWTKEADAPYRPVSIVSQHVSYDGWTTVTISGTIQNTSAYALTDVRLVGSLYDSGDGILWDYIGELAPGQRAPYLLTHSTRYGVSPPENPTIQAQGRIKE